MEKKTLEEKCTLPWTAADSMANGRQQCSYLATVGVDAVVVPYEGRYAIFIDPDDEQMAKEVIGHVVRIH